MFNQTPPAPWWSSVGCSVPIFPILFKSISNLVLEGGFTPPPSSSPGLHSARSNSLVVSNIQLFRDLGHHHFFIIFPTPFYIDFGSILDPNLERKSLQNRIWSRFFQRPKLHRAIFRIFWDVSSVLLGFVVPAPLQKLPKSTQIR